MPLSAGEKLGPYEILSPIGAGGMGEVYKARDTRLDRTVAIKVLPEHIAKREDLRQRFEREARAVASLNHPHICTLHDIGPGYMVMELIEGETLAARLVKGALPLDQALKVATQIADALDRAHRAGVTHRDIKPQNIMLTRDGVKILDFGLAKSTAKPGPTEATLTNVLTTEGTVIGTPQYMSPEQFEGKEADARADVWAFGAVVYEMVAGQKAFQGKTYSSLVGAILSAEPQPMSVQPLTPWWLDRLVRRCLAKDPECRYQSMRDVLLDLEMPPPEMQIPSRGSSRWPWAMAGAAMLSLGALAFIHFREQPAPPPTLRLEIPSDPPARFPTLSPDGRQLVFAPDDRGTGKLLLRPLDSLEAGAIPDTDGATYPFWSPDSRQIGFFADGKLKKIALGGTRAQTICDAPNARGGAWNRDGVILFAPDVNGPLYRVSAADAGRPVAVTNVEPRLSHRYPAFIGGGRKFLFRSAGGILAGDLDGNAPVAVPLNTDSNGVYVKGEGRTGVLIFRRDEALLAQAFDPEALRVSGEPLLLADRVTIGGHQGFGAFSASENGILVYRKESGLPDRQLVWLSRSGARLSSVGAPGPLLSFDLSPNGKAVAMDQLPASGISYVSILDLGTATASRFAGEERGRLAPLWSPEGGHIVYISMASNASLLRKPAAGGIEEKLGQFGTNFTPSDFSPDGKRLIYSVSGEKSNDDLWFLPIEDNSKSVPFLQTAAREWRAQFSPAGDWLAYESNESGRLEIWAQPVPPTGAKVQISTDGGTQVRWRRDGKELFYRADSGELMAVPVTIGKSLEHGKPQKLFSGILLPLRIRGFTYQPSADGQRFLTMVAPDRGDAPSPLTVVVNWLAVLNK